MLRFAAILVVTCSAAALAWSQPLTETWSDPSGRLSFRHPAGWPVNEAQSTEPGAVRVYVGPADAECQIWALPKPATANDSPDAVRQRYQRQASERFWIETVEPLAYFRGARPIVGGQSVDVSGAWPIQRVTLSAGDQQVRGTLQGRPGIEFISLCLSFDGADRSAVFAELEASIDSQTATP